MSSYISGLAASLQGAIQNPFGLDLIDQDGKISVELGSVMNCVGYNDALERIVGVARVGLAILALTYAKDNGTRLAAAGHMFRGVLEMSGSFELYLLILDVAFTVRNIATNFWSGSQSVGRKPATT